MITPCVSCGVELVLASVRTQPHCLTDECNLGYAIHLAHTNVERQGDCLLWKGTHSRNGNQKTPVVRVVTDRAKSTRIDFRVLACRDPERELASRRNYENVCGTEGCVEVAHHNLLIRQEGPTKTPLQGRLPAGPLLDRLAIVQPEGMPKKVRQRIQDARKRGWVRVLTVDEVCIDYLKTHPANLYGEEFFVA